MTQDSQFDCRIASQFFSPLHQFMDSLWTSQTSLLFLLALAAASLIMALHLYNQPSKIKRPKYPPIAGTVFHQLLNLHRLAEFHTDLSRKHKTFRMLAPFCNYVYTVDPANVEYILKTNFVNYGKGRAVSDILSDFFGNGIFAVDGDHWRHQRKLASFEFSTRVLRESSSAVFRRTAVRLAKVISANSNKMIDIQELLMKSTLDSISKVGFGVELDTLIGANQEGKVFAKAFDDASAQILLRFIDVLWKVKRLLNVGSEAAMKKNLKIIDDFLYKLIDTKIEQMSQQKDHEIMEKEDILSRFLLDREKNPELTYKYLKDITLNFVIAGRDTTAGTLAWFFYMLCKHPDVQEKVAQEVREATKIYSGMVTVEEFAESLTEEALNKMQYLHVSLTETLRLYPAVPVDVKYCFADDTLPDGFSIKKGDLVNYQPYAMGRMKFLWGEDAEDFKPERWLQGGVFVPESAFKFTAFQAGPRICLGKEFAYRQMKIFAATLLYLFKFKLWDEAKTVKCRGMITLQIDGGLHLVAMPSLNTS